MSHQMAAVEEFTLQHQHMVTLHSKENTDILTNYNEQSALEKLIAIQFVKFSAFYGTKRLITVFARSHQSSLF
jgi:hypothetical protein